MSNKLTRCSRQILVAQLAILMLSTAATVLIFSTTHAIAVAAGICLAVLNTLLARRSVERAAELAYKRPELSMAPVFTGLMQRFIMFAAGFIGAVLVLKLLPLPILIGFGFGQFGYLACRMQ